MKRVVILGGGTGQSTLLRGLKELPIDISAVVSVCDDGRSTGRLREEFNIFAVGDIRKVIVSLSETEPLFEELLNYRFETTSDLNGHTVGNLLLTALSNITGNMQEGIETIGKVLKIKGKVLPFTLESPTLIGQMEDNSIIKGEHYITESPLKIRKVFYENDVAVNPNVLKEIEQADLIILSMGSLYTSIIPDLLSKKLINTLDKSKAKIMYVCNMMTQPGETDNFKVSDHVEKLNKYLGKRKLEIVVANNAKIDKKMAKFYETTEQKDPVILDKENIDIKVIEDNYIYITDNNLLRHDNIKLGFDIFYYLTNRR